MLRTNKIINFGFAVDKRRNLVVKYKYDLGTLSYDFLRGDLCVFVFAVSSRRI